MANIQNTPTPLNSRNHELAPVTVPRNVNMQGAVLKPLLLLIVILIVAVAMGVFSSSSELNPFVIVGVVVGALLFVFWLAIPRRQPREVTVRTRAVKVSPSTTCPASGFFSKSKNVRGVCSICLCETAGEGSYSKCCRNAFHQRCLRTYWETIDVVRCPNCRLEVPK